MSNSRGDNIHHESAFLHVTGRALYVDDLPEPPDILWAMVLPSPHARARILSRDATAALERPGVHAVLFAGDVPGANLAGPIFPDEPLLATDQVHCVGQAVAVVYAESPEFCRKALGLVRVEYEPLPAVVDLGMGIRLDHFIGEPHRIRRGEPGAVLESAPHRLKGVFRSPAQDHFYMETQAALALPGENRSVLVYSSTQHPSGAQKVVADNLGWSRNRVEVVVPRMGGAFGGKESQGAHWASIAALGAGLFRRPTKCVLDRDQDMIQTGKRHAFLTEWEVGFNDLGKLLVFKARVYADGGWSTDLSLSILDRALFHLDNAYFLPVVDFLGRVVRTNTPSSTALRGFGGPQGMLVVEQVMERVADHLSLDPMDVRRANLYGLPPTDLTPYGQAVSDFRLPRMLQGLEHSAQLADRRRQVERFNAQHQHLKRGIALSPVKFGISFTSAMLNQAGAALAIYGDGTVQLNHGGTEMGQGLHTKMLQVCARALGIGIHRIRPMPTSTSKVPNTSPTAASSGSDLNGQAVRSAARLLLERLRPVAAAMMDRDPDSVRFVADGHRPGAAVSRPTDGGAVWACGKEGRSLSFAQVCGEATLRRVHLAASGYYRTPGIAYDRQRGVGTPFHYFAFGVAVSQVEISAFTGEWKLQRVDILHDVGDSLSPALDLGQVEGGFVQGLGWLTSEELIRDEGGRLLTHSPSTYKIPAISDVPVDFRVSFLDRAHQARVIYGSKAVGEPPLMLAISAYLALCRAVAAFGKRQFADLELPATPESILRAVQLARE